MSWSIEYDPGALKDLQKLDRSVQREILNYMDRRIAADNPRQFGSPSEEADSDCGVTGCGIIGSFASFRTSD